MARVSCPGDADYAVITVSSGVKLTATAAPEAGLDLELRLYKSDDEGALVATATSAGPGGAESAVYKNSSMGDQKVYIRVSGVSGAAAYELTATNFG